jgi:hypothetical protein
VLTAVDITNSRSDTLHLSLVDTSNGYSIRDIEGLDPVDATLTTSSMAQVDGAQPQNAQRGQRNITFKIGLEPDFATNSVQSLRSDLYNYLITKAIVQMGFYIDDELFVVTTGQVETFANTLFSADPEVDISILCNDPDFYDTSMDSFSLSTVTDTTNTVFNYEGTSNTGIIFTLNVNATMSGFVINNTAPDNSIQKMSISGSFLSGDIVIVNTIPGSKQVTLTRAGVTASILYDMDPTATWIELQRGNNTFWVSSAVAAVPYTVTYTAKYGAI